MARLVVSAAIGIVAGVVTGNPVIGLQAFTLAYGVTGFLDPHSKVLGPKLNDLKAPQASYGAPIPYIEGAPRLAGCYIWASDKREIANTQTQGKGGPGVDSTTFTYEMDVLIELAINRCQAIRRVWSNGLLVWTNADDADTTSIVASSQTTAWRDMRFYDGAPDQLPDPTYEAAVGIGNAPAYRGRSTVMIEGMNLGGSGQVPILTFEVLSEADQTYSSPAVLAAITQGPSTAIRDTLVGTPHLTDTGFIVPVGQWDNSYTAPGTVIWYSVKSDGSISVVDITEEAAPGGFIPGLSDVDCYVTAIPRVNTTVVRCVQMGNRYVDFSYGGGTHNVTGSTSSFTRGENYFVMLNESNGGMPQVISIFNATTGAFLGNTPDLGTFVGSASIKAAKLYALADDSSQIWVIDLATQAIDSTITPPTNSGTGSGRVVWGEDGNFYFLSPDGPFYRRDGTAWTLVLSTLGSLTPDETSQHGVTGSTIFSLVNNGAGISNVYFMSLRTAIVAPSLADVVERLCVRTGLLVDADLDVTALADDVVHAMAISQVSTTRTSLEMLMGAYLFEATEGETLKFVKRGGSSVAAIPYADMSASADGTGEPLPLNRVNDIEVAARVSIKYANILNDFQDGLAQADRLVTESTAESAIEIPLGLTPTEAAKLADASTLDAAVGLVQIGPVSLPRKYAALEPTDVITLTDAMGDAFRARITKGTIGAGVYTFEMVLDDASVINSAAATDTDYASSTLVRLLADTDLELLDIPILRDADDSAGFYAAFGATGSWPGAELDKSSDGVTYEKLLDASSRATIGTASTTLGNFAGGNVFDEVNALTVNVGDGTLSSSTRDVLLAGTTNALLVGAEIIQFRTATLGSPGVYVLSGLLRGLRGTGWAMSGHGSRERVVLLQTAGLRKVPEEVAEIGTANYYKGVTHGKSRAEVTAQTFTDTGVALKPFAPVDFHYDPRSTAPVITWHRRSRLSSRFLAETDPRLGEATESYDVEHRDSSNVLKESATVTVPTFTASTVASGDYVTVWQRSASVGRGYPSTITF